MYSVTRLFLTCAMLAIFCTQLSAQVTSEGIDSIAACAARNTWIGAPKTSVTAVAGGCMRKFINGNIYFKKAVGVFEVHGMILDKYELYDGPDSLLGFPLSDETTAPDGVGMYNHFEGGSIYYHPSVGAFLVYGQIRAKWSTLGWELGILGYPTSDEFGLQNGGRCNRFQHGNIYYHPTHGTHPIFGEIMELYSDQNWENGTLGYPTSDPGLLNGVLSQYFEHGILRVDETQRDLRSEIGRRKIVISDQGARPTCSVHAMLFLLEYAYTQWCGLPFGGWASDLSEEYLNHAANVASGRNDDGDFFSYIAMGYDTFGIVAENVWPYDTTKGSYNYTSLMADQSFLGNWQTMATQGKLLLGPGLKMRGYFIKSINSPVGLTNAEFDTILAYVRNGIPVAIGRSHSTVIVGFVLNNSENGGGHFIIRNSYGDWTNNNGYFTESFASVKSTVNDAYVYEMPYRGTYTAPILIPVSIAGPTVVPPVLRRSVTEFNRIFTIDGRAVHTPINLLSETVITSTTLKDAGLTPGIYFVANGTKVIKRIVR